MDISPGIHPGIPMRAYHALPAVNAGLLRTIVERCPAAAFCDSWLNESTRLEEQPNATLDKGAIAHALLLEGDDSRVAVIDPMAHPAKTTGAIPEGWTNQSIRAARDRAYAEGKLPILKPAMEEIVAMVRAAREFIDKLREEEPAIWRAFQPDGGESEVTMLWDEDGTLCRIRPDRINCERNLVVDYKSTDGSAEPSTWGRAQLIRMGFYQSAAFYRRGIRKLCGTDCDYVFLVQETSYPYLCSLVGVDSSGFALGAAKVDYGLTLWKKCARVGVWPHYPPRVVFVELPPWEQMQWEEREALGIPYDPAKLWGGLRESERGAP